MYCSMDLLLQYTPTLILVVMAQWFASLRRNRGGSCADIIGVESDIRSHSVQAYTHTD